VHYCGIVPMQRMLQLALLEEVRDPEPPIRLSALFYEPGSVEQVTEELRGLGEVVVGVARGAEGVMGALELPAFSAEEDGPVPEGAYQDFPLFETDPDGVFNALQGRRLPAKRHPYGMQLRIEELIGDRITDEGGDLWHRRIEELDAVACALCAHRYAVGHASWLGGVVLPGTGLPDVFSSKGVMPPVERINLP
jgi:Protein of unknown function (DUF429)